MTRLSIKDFNQRYTIEYIVEAKQTAFLYEVDHVQDTYGRYSIDELTRDILVQVKDNTTDEIVISIYPANENELTRQIVEKLKVDLRR